MRDVSLTLSKVEQWVGKTLLIKLGGSVLQDLFLLNKICEDIARVRRIGVRVAVVHGGGPAINLELERRGITWEFVEGQRVTTPEMMDTIEMVLCGHVNRRIVRGLFAEGLKPVGLSGADAGTLLCRRASERLGQVGEVESVDPGFLREILKGEKEIPVIAPVGVGRDGRAYNVNADWAASNIAVALEVDKLIFLTDQEGILSTDQTLLAQLRAVDLEQLIEKQIVTGGMLAKTRTILHALRSGVPSVHVLNAKRPRSLLEGLFTDARLGSVCRLEAGFYDTHHSC